MLNDPTPEKESGRKRRAHPLEQRPVPPSDGEQASPRKRVTLHIPVAQPTVTYALIAINVVIYFVAWYVVSDAQLNDLYNWGASNQTQVLILGEYHRLLSAMFLHASLPHIVFNMYALYVIGQTVERFFGHGRFIIVYFVGGLCGSILSVMLNGPNVNSVGASGAVFAIFGAEMVFLYKHRKLLGEMGRSQLRQLIIIAGLNLAFGLATSFSSAGVQIDNWGHIGGLLGGLAVSWLIGPEFIFKRHPNNPDALMTEDANPLERRYQPLLAFVSAMLIVLIVATVLAR